MNTRRIFAARFAAACATALLAAGLPAQAQQKMILKASDVQPAGYPTVEAIERMGKKLSAATNGRLSVQMFPSMQLGGEKEMIEQCQVGALQIARISVGAMGPVVDDLNVFNLPFIFRDEAHMRKVIDGPIGQELLDRITASPQSRLVVLGWMDAGTRNVYSNKPVTKPADLKRGLVDGAILKPAQWKFLEEQAFTGFDNDANMVKIAILNLYLHQLEKAHIEIRNALTTGFRGVYPG